MITEAIIVAVIALIGQVIIAALSNNGIISKLDKQSEVADTKIHGEIDVIKNDISTLRQEVQKHNQIIERTYKLERDVALINEKIGNLSDKQ